MKTSLSEFQQIIPLLKMVAILNFRIFFIKCKTQKSLYLKNRARYSDFDKIFDQRDTSCEYLTQFSKIFLPPKMAAILNFSNFLQKPQNTKMLVSRKPCQIERFWQIFLCTGYQ